MAMTVNRAAARTRLRDLCGNMTCVVNRQAHGLCPS